MFNLLLNLPTDFKFFYYYSFKLYNFYLVPLHICYVIAAAAAKSLQSCPTLCDAIDGSPPGSPSLGFSRQEQWSGLPFPSPMHESESEVTQLCPTQQPHGLQPTRLLHPWDSPGKIVSNSLPKFSALIFITLNTVSQSDKLQSIFDSLRRQGVKC